MTIKVKSYPVAEFSTADAATGHAESHPQLPDARRDADWLKNSVLIDACWSWYEWVLRFDCGTSLCIGVERAKICWRLELSESVAIGHEFQRVGSPPVTLDWGGVVGLRQMDRSLLVARRRGARFKNLQVTDSGLLICLERMMLLAIEPVQRVVDGRAILLAYDSR